jgi:hypothetical protein
VTHRQGDDLELSELLVLHEPRPTATLDTGKVAIERLLEAVEVSPVLLDGLGELTARGLSSTLLLGGKVLPEETVVDVPSDYTFVSDKAPDFVDWARMRDLPSVELQQRLQVDLRLHVVACQGCRILLLRLVETVHIGLVVLGVVELFLSAIACTIQCAFSSHTSMILPEMEGSSSA